MVSSRLLTTTKLLSFLLPFISPNVKGDGISTDFTPFKIYDSREDSVKGSFSLPLEPRHKDQMNFRNEIPISAIDEMVLFQSNEEDSKSLIWTHPRDVPFSIINYENYKNERKLSGGESIVNDPNIHEMSVEVAYEDTYKAIVFIIVIFLLGQVASRFGMPSLVGEIFAGILLGPQLADYVPYKEAAVLVGEIGLIMLLLEAGIDIDVGQLKETGTRSFLMGITGSILPLSVGLALAKASGASIRTAIAVGATFSPTSLGVASNALSVGKVLNTPVGQLVIAACVVDDILGLVLLSMLEVLVKKDAKVYEYFIPLISSFGFLFVIGLSSVTWLPKVLENHLMPKIPEKYRELSLLGLMVALLMAYMPMMNYSKASYLTGAFLAGLPFSQMHSIHSTFVERTHQIMKWILRVFFAATIGFQIPIKNFGNSYVLSWGFAFYLCILAKIPLGFFVPKFQEKTPLGFPYNPYFRDYLITGFAMSCRGEFSFIIAAFALGQGLFSADTYSAIVFAVLLSCVTSPFILLYIINYYNKQSKKFFDMSHPSLIANDGQMHLYLSIQIRSGLQWGMQDALHKTAHDLGLLLIDHRSWHPRGLDAIVATEMYVQDSETMIKIPKLNPPNASSSSTSIGKSEEEVIEDSELMLIAKRCAKIENSMKLCLSLTNSKVQVLQWSPHTFKSSDEGTDFVMSFQELSEEDRDLLMEEARKRLDHDETIDTKVDEVPTTRRRRLKMKSAGSFDGVFNAFHLPPAATDIEAQTSGANPPTIKEDEDFIQSGPKTPNTSQVSNETIRSSSSTTTQQAIRRRYRTKTMSVPVVASHTLWDDDKVAKEASTRDALYHVKDHYDTSSGPSFGAGRRKKMKSDVRLMMEAMPTIEERLAGIVREELDEDTNDA